MTPDPDLTAALNGVDTSPAVGLVLLLGSLVIVTYLTWLLIETGRHLKRKPAGTPRPVRAVDVARRYVDAVEALMNLLVTLAVRDMRRSKRPPRREMID